jgi:hypothetical protein
MIITGCFVSPARVDHVPGAYRTALLYGTAAAAFLWSMTIDLKYFRDVLKASPADAMRLVVTQRLVSWGSGIIYFFSLAIPPFLMRIIS